MNYRKILLSTAILAFSFHHAQNLKLNPTSAEERWKGYEQRKKLCKERAEDFKDRYSFENVKSMRFGEIGDDSHSKR